MIASNSVATPEMMNTLQNVARLTHGRRQTFSPRGAKGGGQGAGHGRGANISNGRALDECMDDNWGGGGGKARARGGAAAPRR